VRRCRRLIRCEPLCQDDKDAKDVTDSAAPTRDSEMVLEFVFVNPFAHYRKHVCHRSEVARLCGAAWPRRIRRIGRRLREAQDFGSLIAWYGIAGYNRQLNRPLHRR
jgi:hypothetical protein